MATEKSSSMTSPEKQLASIRRKQIVSSLSSKRARDAFVRQQIETGMPFQIRAMREAQEMNQQSLAGRMQKPQSVISRLEDPRYGRFTINTLLEVASAFDVGLLVTFAPFSALVDRAIGDSFFPGAVQTYKDDVMLSPKEGLDGTNVCQITTDADAENIEEMRNSADFEQAYGLSVSTSEDMQEIGEICG